MKMRKGWHFISKTDPADEFWITDGEIANLPPKARANAKKGFTHWTKKRIFISSK